MTAPNKPEPSAVADYVAALGQLAEPVKAGKADIPGRRGYTYLTLPDLIEAIRPVLSNHRLAFMQDVAIADRRVIVTTHIIHTTGASWTSLPFALPCGSSPQEIGSALTYARRYSLATFVGLAGADDDDAAAAQRQPQRQPDDVLPPVDPQTGEILEDKPAPKRNTHTDYGPLPATSKQLGAIYAIAKSKGLSEKADVLALVSEILEKQITSGSDLKRDEAGQVIEKLKAMTDNGGAA